MGKATKVLNNFLEQLHTYDYYAFAWIVLLFLILIILAIVVRKKIALSVMIILFAFTLLLAGPFLSFKLVHNYLYKTEIEIDMLRKLHYSKSLVVKGTILHKGVENFNRCKLEAKVIKTNQNFFKDFISTIKPINKKIQFIEKEMKPNTIHIFKFIIEPFTYSGDFNVTVDAECTS